jgi:hypothetical protein
VVSGRTSSQVGGFGGKSSGVPDLLSTYSCFTSYIYALAVVPGPRVFILVAVFIS